MDEPGTKCACEKWLFFLQNFPATYIVFSEEMERNFGCANQTTVCVKQESAGVFGI
jgi:hypothetical protein